MSKRQLEAAASQFSTSKPVFKAQLTYNDTSVDFQLKEMYRPDPQRYSDPITKLLAGRFQENFNKNEKKFVHSFDFDSIYKSIVEDIRGFYVEHTELKNPKQSTLYKWLDLHDNNKYSHPASEGFIGLYRYINNNGGKIKCSDLVVTNVLAILELMKEKYEVEQEVN